MTNTDARSESGFVLPTMTSLVTIGGLLGLSLLGLVVFVVIVVMVTWTLVKRHRRHSGNHSAYVLVPVSMDIIFATVMRSISSVRL